MGEKILVVGCGGLGCELLKLLSLDPQNEITTIDDDTIDPTNLNRQFLFSKSDINQSKSITVASKLSGCNKITAIYSKINEYKYVSFYKSFDVVYNCLDNDETRRFVNQRCYIGGVEMVDGGSAGWLGQSFYNGEECFDCLPRRREKIYPVCSIRQKPENFEHCLIWAKMVIDQRDKQSLDEEIAMHNQLNIEPNDEDNAVRINNNGTDSKSEDSCSLEVLEETHEIKDDQLNKGNESFLEVNDESSKKYKRNGELTNLFENTNESSKKYKRNGELTNLFENTNESSKKYKRNGELTNLFENTNENNQMNNIYELALFKAKRFGIKYFSLMESQTFINKIVPSICTTNAIVASLMILSRKNRKNYFLVQNASHFIKIDLNAKRKDCLTCSIPNYQCTFSSEATVKNLLSKFKGESLLTDTAIFDQKSESYLNEFDGDFVIIIKNGCKYRFYLEKGGAEDILVELERIK